MLLAGFPGSEFLGQSQFCNISTDTKIASGAYHTWLSPEMVILLYLYTRS